MTEMILSDAQQDHPFQSLQESLEHFKCSSEKFTAVEAACSVTNKENVSSNLDGKQVDIRFKNMSKSLVNEIFEFQKGKTPFDFVWWFNNSLFAILEISKKEILEEKRLLMDKELPDMSEKKKTKEQLQEQIKQAELFLQGLNEKSKNLDLELNTQQEKRDHADAELKSVSTTTKFQPIITTDTSSPSTSMSLSKQQPEKEASLVEEKMGNKKNM